MTSTTFRASSLLSFLVTSALAVACGADAGSTDGDSADIVAAPDGACATVTRFEKLTAKPDLAPAKGTELSFDLAEQVDAETVAIEKFATTYGEVFAFYDSDGVASDVATTVYLVEADAKFVAKSSLAAGGKTSWTDSVGTPLVCASATASKACGIVGTFDDFTRSELKDVGDKDLPAKLEDSLDAETVAIKKFAGASGDVYAFYGADGVASTVATTVSLTDASGEIIALASIATGGALSWTNAAGKPLVCAPSK